MSSITRRHFVNCLLQTTGVLGLPGLTRQALGQTSFTGKLLVTVQCQGAWDVTSFCDPKTNVSGEPEINHWARSGSIGTAGNLKFAPFGNNQKFFSKHFQKMLVINGVDAQTNAHETGEVVNWSGRSALGYPSVTALYAASKAPDLALSYINLGGWGNTEGIINSTRISSPQSLRAIIYPNVDNYQGDRTYLGDSDLARVQALHRANMKRMLADSTAMPQDLTNRSNFDLAMISSEGLKAFGALIPPQDQIQPIRAVTTLNSYSSIHQQVQFALLAFKSGLAVAADLREGGFDTHERHDSEHEPLLTNVLDAVDYLWDYAEQLGLANRLVVVMGSDFGRTPYYNAGAGKDHWNIGSYVVMEKNAPYTNRIVGETDGAHNAKLMDPQTLQRKDSGGTLIYTKHVHKALRKYLGLENTVLAKLFPYNSTEDFKFFG